MSRRHHRREKADAMTGEGPENLEIWAKSQTFPQSTLDRLTAKTASSCGYPPTSEDKREQLRPARLELCRSGWPGASADVGVSNGSSAASIHVIANISAENLKYRV